MAKKNSNKFLIGGALALGVIALVQARKNDPWADVKNNMGMAVSEQAQQQLTEEVENAKNEGRINEGQANEILSNFNTVFDETKKDSYRVSAGVEAINQAYSAGVQLPRTSRILKENVSGTIKSTGEKVTGNIVELGTGLIKHISVKPVSSSSGGSSSSRSSSQAGSSSVKTSNRVIKSNNATISRDPDGRLRIKL